MENSSFIRNFRNLIASATNPNLTQPRSKADEYLTVPSPLERPTFKVPSNSNNSGSRKDYKQVYGFEQDKANYGDERDASKLTWRGFTVDNNDTGEKTTIEVGYDSDGRISGVRKWEGPAQKVYMGKELVGDFFKNNFDRDATDYTIYDSQDNEIGMRGAYFNSETDGAFVPSRAFSRIPKVDVNISHWKDSESAIPTAKEQIKEMFSEDAAEHGQRYVLPDGRTAAPAWNGNLEPFRLRLQNKVTVEAYNEFVNKRDIFRRMVADWSLESDPDKRQQIIKDYDAKYGFSNNPLLGDRIVDLSWHDYGDKNEHDAHKDSFNFITRMEYLDATDADFDYAEKAFNPYSQA